MSECLNVRGTTIVSKLAVLLAVAFGSAAGEARALTFLDLATGDEALPFDARSAALGRTRMSEAMGAFTAATNPAHLARLDGVHLGAGGGVQKLKETRSIPAYDSFDGFLVESIYVLNDEYQYTEGAGVAGSRWLEGLQARVGFGAAFTPLRDFQYDYTEEVRDNNAFTQPRDQLVALNQIDGSGILGAYSIGAGIAGWRERLALGLAVQILDGRQDVVERTLFFDPQSRNLSITQIRSLTGTRILGGASVRPIPSVDASFTFASATEVEGSFQREGDATEVAYFGALADSTTVSGTTRIEYPAEFAIGVAYRPRAKVRTTIRLEASWVEWSKFEHELFGDLGLDDVWDARLGIEHVFFNGFPARFGFVYRPSPIDREIASTAFTFGSGIDAGPLRADVGFEIGSRQYRFEDLFADSMFGGRDRVQTDRVEEASTLAYLTLSYRTDLWE